MPDAAAATPADSDCSDLTTMEEPGVEVALEPDARQRLAGGDAGRLGAGVRRIFRASLRAEPPPRAGAAPPVRVDAGGEGPIGWLPPAAAVRYRPVMEQLSRAGRVGVCAGVLQRGADGALEARLLLHEPYECLRRIEADLLDAITGSRGRAR